MANVEGLRDGVYFALLCWNATHDEQIRFLLSMNRLGVS
jgi:hypothetical protein